MCNGNCNQGRNCNCDKPAPKKQPNHQEFYTALIEIGGHVVKKFTNVMDDNPITEITITRKEIEELIKDM